MPKNQISPAEYALLNVAVAQKLAGPGKTPTARQVGEAVKQSKDAVLRRGVGVRGGTTQVDSLMNRVRNELSGISGMGDDECGGLWDKIKSIVVKTSPAVPFVGPTYGLAVPIVKSIAAQQAKQAQRVASQAALETANKAVLTATDNEHELALDDEHPSSSAGESITHAYDMAEKELDMMGGDAPPSMRRRRRRHRAGTVQMLGVPPEVFQISVIQRANKLARGRKPSTKDIFVAHQSVKKDMERAGARISIPHARPGRVTR